MNNLLISLFVLFSSSALFVEGEGNLSVHIQNIDPIQGKLYIAIFREKDRFLKEEYRLQTVHVTGNEEHLEIIFEGLPYDTYAVSIFHDLNNNKELDTRLGIIPREPFGFSDEKKKIKGPPSFKGCSFKVNQPSQSVLVSMRNF